MKSRNSAFLLILVAALVTFVGCSRTPSTIVPPSPMTTATSRVLAAAPPTATLVPSRTATRTPSPTATTTSTASPTTVPTRTPTPQPSATPAATRDPDEWVTVEALRAREYGVEGSIERVEVIETTDAFTRYLIRYPSDDLSVGGFMNVPHGEGPFPVIIVNHGYMPQREYETLTYTTKYADILARAGYLVLHPNFRNHPGSGYGPNNFRTGYAIDVLNLIELVRTVPEANADAIGLWGHSMGGGITLRALVVTDKVKAALVYGSMSADEAANYYHAREMGWSGAIRGRGGRMIDSPEARPEFYARTSPINALDNVSAAVSIHHGEEDEQVPFQWSVKLFEALQAAGKEVELYVYPDQPHNFVGAGYDLFVERMINFFDAHLK